jgi:hypothetical protein
MGCILLTLVLLSGCGEKEAIQCPFTELGWDTTIEELVADQGECEEPYDSTYGGQVYSYPASYMGYDGTIKYMYDEDDVLMSVAFAYGSEDSDELKTFYDALVSSIEEEYGESSYNTDKSTNYGKVWELKEGHIILSVMLTSSNKALQIAYVNPLNQEKD